MTSKQLIDDVLQVWGERLFYRPIQRNRAASPLLGTYLATSKASAHQNEPVAVRAAKVRRKLEATLKKYPEVMIKISGSGKNCKQIKHHFDYISRKGEIELESQDGIVFHGKEAVNDIHDQWTNGRHVIPTDEGTKRESFNIVLSMPPGTNRQAVKDAVRAFAKDEFGGRFDYVFAAHNDEQHPHVHLVVKAQGYDGKRLNPRKADLQSWREAFAERLREQGIEANATKRPTRGVTKVPVKQSIVHLKKRGMALNFEVDREIPPGHPLVAKAVETRQKVIEAYGELARYLAQSAQLKDRPIALAVVNLVRTMPANKLKNREREHVMEREITHGERDIEW